LKEKASGFCLRDKKTYSFFLTEKREVPQGKKRVPLFSSSSFPQGKKRVPLKKKT
jgi:hypothetical protein